MKDKYSKSWLRKNGYDGLLSTEISCGCYFNNLHECKLYDDDNNDHDCIPAYKQKCYHCGSECDSGIDNDDSYCMTTDKTNPMVRQREMDNGRWTKENENHYQIQLYKEKSE